MRVALCAILIGFFTIAIHSLMSGTAGADFGGRKATATAAMVSVVSPTPIIVTHPTASGALSANGNPAVTICGGPSQSIQVNSSSLTAVSLSGNPSINLTHAGPLDLLGDCTLGTGGDFGVFGGPVAQPAQITTGSGSYLPGAYPVYDPLGPLGANVAAPTAPAAAVGKKAFNTPAAGSLGWADGTHGCPAFPSKHCVLYTPGSYSAGINVQNETAIFAPGIYYITSGGFGNAANGEMDMATGVTDSNGAASGLPVANYPGYVSTGTGWTGNILVYNTGAGVFSIGANSTATLVGSPSGSAYKGILFFEDRAAAAHTHTLGGGGAMTLSGTIYFPSANQALNLQGGSGSSTKINGQIIVGTLALGGNSAITMNLNSASSIVVLKIALVN